MKACIVIRGMNKPLVEVAMRFLGPLKADGFKFKAMWGTTADGYLESLLGLDYDWVVNVDEDAFVWDCGAILRIIRRMKDEGIVCAGVSDGVRSMNPVAMNPFFTVLNLAALPKPKPGEIAKCVFSRDMVSLVPERFGYQKVYAKFEGYYSFTYWLIGQGKLLYLDAKKGAAVDEWGTTVKGVLNEEFMVHAWHGRECSKNPERFNKFIRYADERRKKLLG